MFDYYLLYLQQYKIRQYELDDYPLRSKIRNEMTRGKSSLANVPKPIPKSLIQKFL